MNCLIIDGNKESCRPLERIVKQSGHLKLVASCGSAAQAEDVFLKHKIDVIFIDELVQPERAAGFLNYLQFKKPYMIVVRSGKRPTDHAYDVNTTDFIMKPLSGAQFRKVMNKVIFG